MHSGLFALMITYRIRQMKSEKVFSQQLLHTCIAFIVILIPKTHLVNCFCCQLKVLNIWTLHRDTLTEGKICETWFIMTRPVPGLCRSFTWSDLHKTSLTNPLFWFGSPSRECAYRLGNCDTVMPDLENLGCSLTVLTMWQSLLLGQNKLKIKV